MIQAMLLFIWIDGIAHNGRTAFTPADASCGLVEITISVTDCYYLRKASLRSQAMMIQITRDDIDDGYKLNNVTIVQKP